MNLPQRVCASSAASDSRAANTCTWSPAISSELSGPHRTRCGGWFGLRELLAYGVWITLLCTNTSIAFGQHCRKMGVRPSTGSVGDAYDNAMAESFFASLECGSCQTHLRETSTA